MDRSENIILNLRITKCKSINMRKYIAAKNVENEKQIKNDPKMIKLLKTFDFNSYFDNVK